MSFGYYVTMSWESDMSNIIFIIYPNKNDFDNLSELYS
jgi:hypothetical protein